MVRGALRLAPWAGGIRNNFLLRPFWNAGIWYSETAKKSPFVTGIVTTTLKTSAADMFAQLVVERKEELDLRRHLTFCTFGAFFPSRPPALVCHVSLPVLGKMTYVMVKRRWHSSGCAERERDGPARSPPPELDDRGDLPRCAARFIQ